MSERKAEFEGYTTAGKLKSWIDEMLDFLQSSADQSGEEASFTMTITVKAKPQNKPDESEPA